MAFSNSILYQTMWGNKKVVAISMVADANSGSITTGLSVVESVQATVVSAATGAQKFKMNLSAASAAANGSIMVSSCTNGDVFQVLAIGH